MAIQLNKMKLRVWNECWYISSLGRMKENMARKAIGRRSIRLNSAPAVNVELSCRAISVKKMVNELALP